MSSEVELRRSEWDWGFRVLTWVVGILSFCKGFRFPGLWAGTHFTFNYSQGFLRRGLVGEIVRRLTHNHYHYNHFVIFSFVLLFGVGIAFGLLTRYVVSRQPNDSGFRMQLLVFWASPSVVFLVHMIGYFDWIGIGALLLVFAAAIRSPTPYVPLLVLVILSPILTFTHEVLNVIFAPAMGFILLCQMVREARERNFSTRDWWVRLALVAGAMLLALVPAILLSARKPETQLMVDAIFRYSQSHSDYTINPDALSPLTRSTKDCYEFWVPWFWGRAIPLAVALKPGLVAFIPSFIFIFTAAMSTIWISAIPRWQRTVLCIALFLAAIAPITLNFVAWDWPRWNAMSLLILVVGTMAFKSIAAEGSRSPAAPKFLVAGAALTALALASTTPLFSDIQVQFFPFLSHYEFFKAWTPAYRPSGG